MSAVETFNDELIDLPMADGNFWGDLIAHLRGQHKISQRQFSTRVGIDRSTLRRIEEDGSSSTLAQMETILAFFGYSLEALEDSSIEERLRREREAETNPHKRARLAAQRIIEMPMK